MKAIKIILVIAVVAVIGFFVWKWLVEIDMLRTVPPPSTNPFTARIEREIDSLIRFPSNVFSPKFYQDIQYRIDDYHKQGFLGNSQSDNNQWKEILSKNLYAAYASKFVEQAMYVFTGSEWNITDLNFIRSEVRTLQNSTYLGPGSPVATSFTNMLTVLAKYDEITNFIASCRGFSYTSSGLSDSFPIANVQGKLSQAKTYQINRLENEYVNNCTRLQDGLKDIPAALFSAHVRYLDDKISQWSGLYCNGIYISHADYVNNLNRPLRDEIDALEDNTYGVSNSNSEHRRLLDRWSADNQDAFVFFSRRTTN